MMCEHDECAPERLMAPQIDSRSAAALGNDLSHVTVYRGDMSVFSVPHYVWLLLEQASLQCGAMHV